MASGIRDQESWVAIVSRVFVFIACFVSLVLYEDFPGCPKEIHFKGRLLTKGPYCKQAQFLMTQGARQYGSKMAMDHGY